MNVLHFDLNHKGRCKKNNNNKTTKKAITKKKTTGRTKEKERMVCRMCVQKKKVNACVSTCNKFRVVKNLGQRAWKKKKNRNKKKIAPTIIMIQQNRKEKKRHVRGWGWRNREVFDTHNCPIVNRVVNVESGVVWKKGLKKCKTHVDWFLREDHGLARGVTWRWNEMIHCVYDHYMLQFWLWGQPEPFRAVIWVKLVGYCLWRPKFKRESENKMWGHWDD